MKWNDPARANGKLRPHDYFTLGYLSISLVLIVLFSGRLSSPWTLALWHAAGIAGIVLARRSRIERYRLGALVMDFYPVALFSYLYLEVQLLNRIFVPEGYLDDLIIRWEAAVFGGAPSQTLHLSWPNRVLGEYLHLSYVCYYLIVPLMAFTVRFTRSVEDYERAIATVCATFYISFLCFIAIPVVGPYQLFSAGPVEQYGYVFPSFARWILDRGSSIGTAFPSSHVSVSVATWIMAIRFARPVAIFFLFIVPTMAVGAVYGGFHYAIDTIVGAGVGVLAGTVGFMVATRLSERAWGKSN